MIYVMSGCLVLLSACQQSPPPKAPIKTTKKGPAQDTTKAPTKKEKDPPSSSEPAWTIRPNAKHYTLTMQDDGIWLGADPNARVNLLPTIVQSIRRGRNQPQTNNTGPLTKLKFNGPRLTKTPQGSWQITAFAQDKYTKHNLTISGSPNAPTLLIELKTQYTQAVFVGQHTMRFDYQGTTPSVLDSNYKTITPKRPHQINQHSPRRLRWPQLTLQAPDAQGIALNPGKATIAVELDHRKHHPFKTYPDCPTTDALPSLWLDETPRYQQEQRTHRVIITLGNHPLPTPRRYPEGHLSAISLTDHADQNNTSRSEAFAFGQTGALKLGQQQSGFVNHGLNYTKTIFLTKKGSYAKQYGHPPFDQILKAMKTQNIDVGIHSVSGLVDTPKESLKWLQDAGQHYTFRTWIDHGPGTNCEAISNQGWDPSSPYYMLDVFDKTPLRTFWAVKDLPVPGYRLNMLAATKTANPLAVVYRHGRLKHKHAKHPPTLFASAWFFGDRKGWIRRFSNKNLDILAKQHGMLLAHTYLDTWRASGKFASRSLLEKNGAGHRLRKDFDTLFENIAKRQARRSVITLGADRLSNHLLDAMAIRITPQPGGSLSIEHTGHIPLNGLTLRLPPQTHSATLDGKPLMLTQRHADGLDVWFDMAPGQVRILRLQQANKTTLNPFQAVHLRIVIPTP